MYQYTATILMIIENQYFQ